jgi:hypothetical protein
MTRYTIVEDGQAIKCHTCGLTSYHPEDVRHRFCGKCNVFHEDEELFERLEKVDAESRPVPLDQIPGLLESARELLARTPVTCKKPPAYNPRPMTAEPAGFEPPFATAYIRRVRVEED